MAKFVVRAPSLRNNTIANYISQFYISVVGIAVTPFYLEYLGAEAYGLVGFFTLLQTWLNLLDVGLTPTLGRQIAFARGKVNGFAEFRRLLKSFEFIFFGLSFLAVSAVYFSSSWLGSVWINAQELEPTTIAYCISLMGVMIGLRWFSSLYRSGISGLEDQVWLSAITTAVVSFKFLGALVLIANFSISIATFFEYQLIIGCVELFLMMGRFYHKLPPADVKVSVVSFHWTSVKAVAPFALSIAYTTSIWVFVSQLDKLVLSNILPLSEFGFFSLVIIIASGINVLSAPISQAIQPRMTYLLSSGKEAEMLDLYRGATQLVTLISVSVSVMVALYSESLIYAWTGNLEAASWARDVLFWYALGNGVLSIISFQYFLQVSHGKLNLHVLGSTISVLVDVPVVLFAAYNFGALGAGIAWFSLRTFWGLVWIPVVHARFAPGLHWRWLFNDVLSVVGVVVMAALFVSNFILEDVHENRLWAFVEMLLAGAFVLLVSTLGSSFIRTQVVKRIKFSNAST